MKTIAERYQITAPIGRGGMGEVWKGMDLRLNRAVAIKLIYSAEKEATRRFYREARITARLRHPGVPAVYDFGSDGGELFMVMEHIDGESVGKLIDEESFGLPVPWAALIAAQACAVLTAAHAADLLHRDVKPANLVLCRDGTVKVIDFGVATSLGGKEFSQITESGQIPGTARYMAPELMDGAEASRASDLYTVGCLLYELLTGSRPFASRDLMTEIDRSRRESPPAMERSDIPQDLEELTFRLLAKSPEGRPKSVVSVYEVLFPLVKALPPLPGWVDGDLAADPVHMYAAAIQHV